MNTEQIMALADAYAIAHCNFVIPQMARKHLQAAIEALVQDRDALFGSQELIAHVAAALSERMTLAENKCEKYQEENKSLRDAMKPDMFWNNDDAETLYHSIGEFLNDEICNGSLEVGDVRIIQQAKRLPNITIQVTSIDENECEADWEIVPALTRKQS
jgi:hypothetical protein